MEKIELKNGDQIQIENGATENAIKVKVASIEEFKKLYKKFTDDNLKQISFLNEADVVCAIYKDKTLSKAELANVLDDETEESKLIAAFVLKDIDTTKKDIKALQETVDTLALNLLGVDVISGEETVSDNSLDKDLEIEEQRDEDDANEIFKKEGEEDETNDDEIIQE